MMVHFILSRLKEPSTFAGLSGIALALGMSGELYNAVAGAIAGVAGLVAVLLADKPDHAE
jgi:hypothetical protein